MSVINTPILNNNDCQALVPNACQEQQSSLIPFSNPFSLISRKISSAVLGCITPWHIAPTASEYTSSFFPTKSISRGFWNTDAGMLIKKMHSALQQQVLSKKSDLKIEQDLTRRIEEQSTNSGEVMAELIIRSGSPIDRENSSLPLALIQKLSQTLYERHNDLLLTEQAKKEELRNSSIRILQSSLTDLEEFVSIQDEITAEQKIDALATNQRELQIQARKIRDSLIENKKTLKTAKEAINTISDVETTLFQNKHITFLKTETIQNHEQAEVLSRELAGNIDQFFAVRCVEVDEDFKNYRTIGATLGNENTLFTPRVGTSWYETRKGLKRALNSFLNSSLKKHHNVIVTIWTKTQEKK